MSVAKTLGDLHTHMTIEPQAALPDTAQTKAQVKQTSIQHMQQDVDKQCRLPGMRLISSDNV